MRAHEDDDPESRNTAMNCASIRALVRTCLAYIYNVEVPVAEDGRLVSKQCVLGREIKHTGQKDDKPLGESQGHMRRL